MNKSEKLSIIQRIDKSIIHFGPYIWPDAFYDPFSKQIHYPLVQKIDQLNHSTYYDEGAFAAPRGIGKSTLAITVNITREVAMQRYRYFLIICETLDQAMEHLKGIKQTFESNERFIELFGELEGKTEWNQGTIVTTTGIKIRAMGAGQQIRGRREGMDRPDYALLSDFESEESVNSEAILLKRKKWKNDDLKNSLKRNVSKMLHEGTVLSGASILEEDLNNPYVLSVRLELFDDNYISKWPEVYPQEKIERMKAEAIAKNNLDGLYRDFRNIAVASENRKFHYEWMKNWEAHGDNALDWSKLFRFLIIDPAKTTTNTADYTALVAVGVTMWGTIFELDYSVERVTNEDMYEEAARLTAKWGIKELYVETNGINDYITQPLQNYLRSKKLLTLVHGIHSSGHKMDRIKQLITPYKMGSVFHSPHHEKAFFVHGYNQEDGTPRPLTMMEAQLLDDRSKYDDLKDCFATIIKIMTMRNLGRLTEGNRPYRGNPAVLRRSKV